MYEFWHDLKEIWWKFKTFFYRLRQLHYSCESRWYCIAEDVETRFDTSSFELDRPLPHGKN